MQCFLSSYEITNYLKRKILINLFIWLDTERNIVKIKENIALITLNLVYLGSRPREYMLWYAWQIRSIFDKYWNSLVTIYTLTVTIDSSIVPIVLIQKTIGHIYVYTSV